MTSATPPPNTPPPVTPPPGYSPLGQAAQDYAAQQRAYTTQTSVPAYPVVPPQQYVPPAAVVHHEPVAKTTVVKEEKRVVASPVRPLPWILLGVGITLLLCLILNFLPLNLPDLRNLFVFNDNTTSGTVAPDGTAWHHLSQTDLNKACVQQYGEGNSAKVKRDSDPTPAYWYKCNNNDAKGLDVATACSANNWGAVATNTALSAPASEKPWEKWYCHS